MSIPFKRYDVLGVPFDATTEPMLIQAIQAKLNEKHLIQKTKPLFIATPNPEMVLEAQRSPEFMQILNRKDGINIADGKGIMFAVQYLHKHKLPARITGTDFMQIMCQKLEGAKIFLLGAAPGVAEQAAKNLKAKYNAEIVGTDSGSASEVDEERILKKINESGANLLFVAFGAPKQEMWLQRNLPKLKNIKVAMGIGGAFDFIANAVPRAPKLMRTLGLEWLFRLCIQPSRIKRIWNAVVRFPIAVYKSKKAANK